MGSAWIVRSLIKLGFSRASILTKCVFSVQQMLHVPCVWQGYQQLRDNMESDSQIRDLVATDPNSKWDEELFVDTSPACWIRCKYWQKCRCHGGAGRNPFALAPRLGQTLEIVNKVLFC